MVSIRKTFTLIELIIVVVIVGILTIALIPKIIGAQENTRNTVKVKNLNTLFDGSRIFFADKGYYPTVMSELVANKYLTQLEENSYCIEKRMPYNPARRPDASRFAAAGISDVSLFIDYCYTYYPEFHWNHYTTTPVVIDKPQKGVLMVILESRKVPDTPYDYVEVTGANFQYNQVQYDIVWSTLAYGCGYATPECKGVNFNCPAYTGSIYPYYANMGSYATGFVNVYYIRMQQ